MSPRAVAARLDDTWKNFAAGLDERTTVMALSSLFHQKAENVSLSSVWSEFIFNLPSYLQYISNVADWSNSCEIQQVSNDISVLEQSIHQHQSLYEGMCQAYTEVSLHCLSVSLPPWLTLSPPLQVHSTSKKLLYQLDHLVQLTNQTPNESPQKKHVSL